MKKILGRQSPEISTADFKGFYSPRTSRDWMLLAETCRRIQGRKKRRLPCSHLRVFGHFFHLLCGFWDGNWNHIGAGQSCVSRGYWVNNLTHT